MFGNMPRNNVYITKGLYAITSVAELTSTWTCKQRFGCSNPSRSITITQLV